MYYVSGQHDSCKKQCWLKVKNLEKVILNFTIETFRLTFLNQVKTKVLNKLKGSYFGSYFSNEFLSKNEIEIKLERFNNQISIFFFLYRVKNKKYDVIL